VNLTQDSSGQDMVNLLTLRFAATVDLPAGAAVTVAGMAGAVPVVAAGSGAGVPLADASGDASCAAGGGGVGTCDLLFSDAAGGAPARGAWNYSAASLTLYLLATLPAGARAAVAWNVTNPTAGQDAPPISLRASIPSGGAVGAVTPAAAAPGGALAVADFIFAQIAQSSAAPGGPNRLTVNLTVRAQLRRIAPGVPRLSLTGLCGAATPSSAALPIDDLCGGAAAAVFGAAGAWVNTPALGPAGCALTLYAAADIQPGVAYAFSFALVNGAAGQAAVAVSVSAAGILIPPRRMTALPGLAAPLLIAHFPVRALAQSSPAAGAANTVSVTLQVPPRVRMLHWPPVPHIISHPLCMCVYVYIALLLPSSSSPPPSVSLTVLTGSSRYAGHHRGRLPIARSFLPALSNNPTRSLTAAAIRTRLGWQRLR
jgi:hypothetical protein